MRGGPKRRENRRHRLFAPQGVDGIGQGRSKNAQEEGVGQKLDDQLAPPRPDHLPDPDFPGPGRGLSKRKVDKVFPSGSAGPKNFAAAAVLRTRLSGPSKTAT